MKFLQKIGAGFARFMYGRNGMDHLNLALVWMCLISSLLSSLLRIGILYYFSMALWCIAIFRMFSKNYAQRRKENEIFLKYKNQAVRFFNKEKQMTQDRVKFHIYTCPSCGQKIRIPRGKGKIAITCPKCKTEFIKKS